MQCSNIEGEESSESKSHHQHRPVREIETQEPAVVVDTRLHDTRYNLGLQIAGATARLQSLVIGNVAPLPVRRCSARASAPGRSASSRSRKLRSRRAASDLRPGQSARTGWRSSRGAWT